MGEGYDPERFVDRVLHGFKCCICQCVLNEPRLCEAEEHQFCLNCISQHLPNSQTCPECRQHLTLKNLKCPGNYFNNVLSQLRLKCDYINRGCPEHVELGNLQNHVNNCEYRPVTCEKCHLEVNAKDEDSHKKSFCQLGGVNIQVIRNIQMCQKEMKNDFSVNEAKQRELGQRLEEVEDDLSRMEADQILQSYKLNKVENSCKEIRTKQDEIKNNVTKSFKEIVTTTNMIQDEMRTEIAGIKRKHDDVQKPLDEMKQTQSGINEKVEKMEDEARGEVTELKRQHDNIYDKVKKMEKALDEIKQKQSGINKKVKKMEKALDEMKQTQSRRKGNTSSRFLMAGGYDPDRFILTVRPDLLCCICQCVLNDPRLCEAGEHYFCFSCITPWLENADSPTCPMCRQPLSPERMQHPQRFLRYSLSELEIRCNHYDRGCPVSVKLGNLQNHENNCEYRPVTCPNCNVEVSERDMALHQNFCEIGEGNIQRVRSALPGIIRSCEELRTITDSIQSNVGILERRTEGFNDMRQTQERIENRVYRVEERLDVESNIIGIKRKKM